MTRTRTACRQLPQGRHTRHADRFATKKDAVDFALRRLVGVPLTKETLLDLRGTGWAGDLDEIRGAGDPWSQA
ncbi:hypothetical protein GCM10009796_18610 [Microbacterium koreense]